MISTQRLLVCMWALACAPLTACGDDEAPAPRPLAPVTPGCFVAREDNPVLRRDLPFAGATWNDPSVLVVDGERFLYASSDTDVDGDGTLDGDIAIYRHRSSDGLTWRLDPEVPVFTKRASPTAWDRKSVETPSVVRFRAPGEAEAKYHLFYMAYPENGQDALSYRIGHAISADGVNFERASESFILGPSGEAGDFRQFIASEPAAVVVRGRLHLYFTAVGIDDAVANVFETIGSITSVDGVTWSLPTRVLVPDQSIYPRGAGWYGYTTPEAVVIEERVHLFYSVVYSIEEDGSDWNMRQIHHAVSPDGERGWVQDLAPIYTRASFTWTTRELRSPAALLDGTRLRLYFGGDDFFGSGAFGIGEASCELGPAR